MENGPSHNSKPCFIVAKRYDNFVSVPAVCLKQEKKIENKKTQKSCFMWFNKKTLGNWIANITSTKSYDNEKREATF
jgi:hypothetical protein